MLRTVGIGAFLAIACVALFGCPREEEPQYPPGYGYGYGQPGYGQPGYGQPTAPPPSNTAPPPGTAPAPTASQQPGSPFPWLPFPFPGAQPAPSGSSDPGQPPPGQAQPIDPAAAQVAIVPLNMLAQNELQGMQPLTDPVAGNFQQGQYLEQPFQMEPGKCYAAVARGASGVTEMDIRFVALTPMPGVSPDLAEDSTTGPDAVLGGRGQCYHYIIPGVGINAKAVYTVRTGSGIAAGRVYVK